MKIFRVSRIYWEDYEPHDLIGPDNCTKEEFLALCESLLHDAAEAALEAEENSEHPSYVGWSEIVTQLVNQLTKHGFTPVEPIEAKFAGSAIIRDNRAHEAQLPDSIVNKVSEYNEKVQRRAYQ